MDDSATRKRAPAEENKTDHGAAPWKRAREREREREKNTTAQERQGTTAQCKMWDMSDWGQSTEQPCAPHIDCGMYTFQSTHNPINATHCTTQHCRNSAVSSNRVSDVTGLVHRLPPVHQGMCIPILHGGFLQ